MRDPVAPSDDNRPEIHRAANPPSGDVPGILRDIAIAYEKGNLGRTAQLVRHGEAMAPGSPYWPYFMGLLAFELKLRDAGLAQCATARQAIPPGEYPELTPQLDSLDSALKIMPDTPPAAGSGLSADKDLGLWFLVRYRPFCQRPAAGGNDRAHSGDPLGRGMPLYRRPGFRRLFNLF
jgi:hypothetical protein